MSRNKYKHRKCLYDIKYHKHVFLGFTTGGSWTHGGHGIDTSSSWHLEAWRANAVMYVPYYQVWYMLNICIRMIVCSQFLHNHMKISPLRLIVKQTQGTRIKSGKYVSGRSTVGGREPSNDMVSIQAAADRWKLSKQTQSCMYRTTRHYVGCIYHVILYRTFTHRKVLTITVWAWQANVIMYEVRYQAYVSFAERSYIERHIIYPFTVYLLRSWETYEYIVLRTINACFCGLPAMYTLHITRFRMSICLGAVSEGSAKLYDRKERRWGILEKHRWWIIRSRGTWYPHK